MRGEPMPWRRMALAGLIAVGLGVAWAPVGMVLGGAVVALLPDAEDADAQGIETLARDRVVEEQLLVTPAGEVVVEREVRPVEDDVRQDVRVRHYLTLNRAPAARPGQVVEGWSVPPPLQPQPVRCLPSWERLDLEQYDDRVWLVRGPRTDAPVWLQLYAPRSGLRGAVGAAGFEAGRAVPRTLWPELQELSEGMLRQWWAARGVWELDLAQPRAKLVWPQPDLCQTLDLETLEPREASVGQPYILRGRDVVNVVDRKWRLILRVVIPPELRQAYFRIHRLDGERLLLVSKSEHDGGWHAAIYWLDQHSRVTRRMETDLRHDRAYFAYEPSPAEYFPAAVTAGISSPSFAGLVAAATAAAYDSVQFNERITAAALREALAEQLSRHSFALYFALAGGLLAVLLGLRRQRRYHAPYTLLWSLFLFLLGPFGLIAYVRSRPWPPLIACPACRRRVPVDRGVCGACGAVFARAAHTAEEIHEP